MNRIKNILFLYQLLEAEDHFEGERKELTGRMEALDSIVRMLELKHKNSLDHASRLEERENELKKVRITCLFYNSLVKSRHERQIFLLQFIIQLYLRVKENCLFFLNL